MYKGHSSRNFRYPEKTDPNSSHSRIVRILGPGFDRAVLEIGCAQGQILSRLRDAGWRTKGIEPYEQDRRKARLAGLDVLSGTAEEAASLLGGEKFEVIVLADVLEHLVDSRRTLASLHNLLESDNSFIILSVPNVAHVSVRLSLLFGKFEYAERGILDKTHLRFFTHSSLTQLVKDAGFQILDQHQTSVPLSQIVPPNLQQSLLYKFGRAIIDFLPRIWVAGFSYQFILCLKRAE